MERRVRALSSGIPANVAARELKKIQSKTNWPWKELLANTNVRSSGPGNVLFIELEYENVAAIFTGFGKIGRRAESVASGALKEARMFIDSETPVNEYLADQLLLPMAIAADRAKLQSRFVTHIVSGHTETHIDLLQRFLDVSIEVLREDDDGRIEIVVSPNDV